MPASILATKLYRPPSRPKVVLRPRLVERLNEGLAAGHRLTLVSAPAGFGKTTLVSEWVAGCGRPAAWLSLDEGDSDPSRFLTYLVAALQTVVPGIGETIARSRPRRRFKRDDFPAFGDPISAARIPFRRIWP